MGCLFWGAGDGRGEGLLESDLRAVGPEKKEEAGEKSKKKKKKKRKRKKTERVIQTVSVTEIQFDSVDTLVRVCRGSGTVSWGRPFQSS